MKKMFLSLATIAFVATGALTVTSCGSDDSAAPNPGPGPGEEDINEGIVNPLGSFKHEGNEYKVENSGFFLHGANNAPVVINFGTEAEPEYRSLWVGLIFSGETNQGARNYMEYGFTLPTEETTNDQGETVYMLIFPNETEDIAPYHVYAMHKEEALSLPGLNAGGILFNTFVFTEGEATMDNSSVWGAGETELISHTYSGEFLGISVIDLSSLLSKGKGVTVNDKINYTMSTSTKMANIQDLKNLEFKVK